MRNEELLHRVKEERNVLHTIEKRKASWIGHILSRNCLLKHVIEGKIKGISEGKTRKENKQLLSDLAETRRHWKLNRKHWIEFCRKLDLEEAMYVSKTDYKK